MSAGDKPPKGPPKPFLAEGELSTELDAWDATFDALHDPSEGGAPADDQVMAWPTPPPPAGEPASRRVPDPALIQPDVSRTLDELYPAFEPGDTELEVQMTLDGAIEVEPAAARPRTWVPEPADADFSDVGAQDRPAALGELLGGRGSTLLDDDDPATKILQTGRPGTPEPIDEDDDSIYTSASRPNLAPTPGQLGLPEDPLAPPPRPTPAVAARRTGPAIIRRTPVSVPIPRVTPSGDYADDGDDGAFGATTRVANFDEIEASAKRARQVPDARSKAPTAPPPFAFAPESHFEPAPVEDDYADIEIDATAEDQVDPIAEPPRSPSELPAAPRRTVAHVVRRPEKSTKPPPVRPSSDPVIEVDLGDDGPPIPVAPATEDDFSDVAEAVGASDDGPIGNVELPRRRPSTPRGEIHELTPVPAAELDDALIDDHLPTIARIDDGDGSGADDAYVQMAPVADALELMPALGPSTIPGTLRALDTEAELEAEPDVSATLIDRGGRPPALADFYPRIKTPTSVPPLGQLRELGLAPDQDLAAPTRVPTPIPAGTEPEPMIDLEAIQLPEQLQPLPSAQLDEDAAAALLVYEREIATADDSGASAALRIEAGRLSERLGDNERARAHYDAALLVDPRATAALRGLRRIARSSSDLAEATRQLDAELAVAGALERRPLGHYRIDLLLASGEQDLARVAVGEILDNARSDVRALLAQLELAFLDGRADEFGGALEQLAHAVTDNELRAAVQSARGVLAAHQSDAPAAASWFAAAAESDPGSLGARLGAIRSSAASGDGEATAHALLDLASQVATTDPVMAAALAIRAQHWVTGETATAAARLGQSALPADPLVARLATETALATTDVAAASQALAAWANCPAIAAERSYAAAHAAELDPGRAAELWAQVMELDPGDDYAAAQLRTAHVAAGATQLAIDVDLAVAADADRERAGLRAAYGLIAQDQLGGAIELLQRAHADRPASLPLAEALAEALAAANRWGDRAKLLGELAVEPGDQLDRDVAQLRSALAWEEAVGAALAASADPGIDPDELQRTTAAALGAWQRVLEAAHGGAPAAHAAAIVLATRLGDHDVLGEVLGRGQASERSPWAAASLAIRRARLVASDDPARAEAILREAPPGLDDPRRTAWLEICAARQHQLGNAAGALEERANQLGSSSEAAALRLRAAQLALDTGDAARATTLLGAVGRALPALGIVPDLLAAARRRAGDRSGPIAQLDEPVGTGPASSDAFARIVRDADHAALHGDGRAALGLYQRALEMRPGDPLAAVPMIRLATQLREPAPLAALAIGQLRAAEDAGDPAAKAEAYELLARIDKELRDDAGSAQIALESASQADPTRIDLMHRLEHEYAVADQLGELLRLRRAELDQIPAALAKDRAAIVMDTAGLAERDQRPDAELTELYRNALAADPRHRLALLHLESIVRRGGGSAELAALEEQIAAYFEGEPRSQAAFFTRAGETLAELGRIDAAVQKFGRAEEVQPGHVPALEGWRQAALKGQLWIDVAEAATRQASAPGLEPVARARLHHFAGVALMDKALAGEQAMIALRRAIEADPSHRDAFMRLRILLEEEGNHDELAILLANRLQHEPDGVSKIRIHRALAELSRNFLGDRETAKQHYREILAADPNDLRAHAAIADIAWEQGAWQDAADALIAMAKLEREPQTLKNLCFRLGLIYADRLGDFEMALKAFQRALAYDPEDEATLVRLADLATQAGEWKLALGACERLVKTETDPDKRAVHLHRVARIFQQGFGDAKRAERALNLALDGAPTNDDALTQLVAFYREAGDMTSVRVQLNRVAGTMRSRVAHDPKDGVAYRVIARAMAARAAAGVDGSLPIARAAAELAQLLGSAAEPERLLLAEPARVDLAPLLRVEADEVLFPRGVPTELRQMFTLLGDRVAKHVGVDLKPYGVSRGDRLRARDGGVASYAQDVATGLGFGEIDVYVSSRQPYAMVAEPTSPVSLVIGQAIAEGKPPGIRFAAGAALKLAQSSLAIPARLGQDELGVLTVALLRLFQPEFPQEGLDEVAIAGQIQKLRRLIPTSLSNELRPFALAIDAPHFRHEDFARGIWVAGLRAGLVAAGSIVAGLGILAAQHGVADVSSFLADPVAQGLISFAIAEDHATVAR